MRRGPLVQFVTGEFTNRKPSLVIRVVDSTICMVWRDTFCKCIRSFCSNEQFIGDKLFSSHKQQQYLDQNGRPLWPRLWLSKFLQSYVFTCHWHVFMPWRSRHLHPSRPFFMSTVHWTKNRRFIILVLSFPYSDFIGSRNLDDWHSLTDYSIRYFFSVTKAFYIQGSCTFWSPLLRILGHSETTSHGIT